MQATRWDVAPVASSGPAVGMNENVAPACGMTPCRARAICRRSKVNFRPAESRRGRHVWKTSDLRTPTSWSAEDRRQGGRPWPVRHLPHGRVIGLGPAALIVPLLVANEYRQFPGIDTRKLIWFLAQARKLDPGQYKGSRDALLFQHSLAAWMTNAGWNRQRENSISS